MAPYQYPQVPRTSHHAALQVMATAGPQEPGNSRFSWVATPADVTGRSWKRQTQVPPVPIVADHVKTHPHPDAHQQPPSQTQQQQQQQQQEQVLLQPALAQEQTDYQQDHRHDIAKTGFHQRPPRDQPESYQTHATPPHSPGTPAPAYIPEPKPKLQMAIPDTRPQNHRLSTTTTKLSPNDQQQYRSPISATPTRSTTQPRVDIAPDENPLHPQIPIPSPTTANMLPVISPCSFNGPVLSTAALGPSRGGTFGHALCSCSHPSICLPSLVCPCITYGKTQYRLNLRSAKKDPTDLLGYRPINASCVAFGLLCGINGILAAIQHTRIRKIYEMDAEAGNVFDDCVRACCCCCCCCVVAQDEKEVKEREEECRGMVRGKKGGFGLTASGVGAGAGAGAGGIGGKRQDEGYVDVQAMVFQGPPPSRK